VAALPGAPAGELRPRLRAYPGRLRHRRAGLAGGLEIFADRAYRDDGQLVPRSQPGAMIHGAQASLDHVLRMLDVGGLVTVSGKVLKTEIHSICVHGDGPDALASARRIATGLEQAGYLPTTLPDTLQP